MDTTLPHRQARSWQAASLPQALGWRLQQQLRTWRGWIRRLVPTPSSLGR